MTTTNELLEALRLEHGTYAPKGKRPRPTVSFLVPLRRRQNGVEELGWLDENGGFTATPEKAARFRVYTARTQTDRIRADRECHAIVGGLDEWHDLESTIQALADELRAQVEAKLWPDGRSETESPEEASEQEAAIAEAWVVHDSPERQLWGALLEQRDNVRFMADWAQIIIEPPAGWETLHDMPEDRCPPWLFAELREAYLIATSRADAGNAQSSER